MAFIAGTRDRQILAGLGQVFDVKVASSELDFSSTQAVYDKLKASYDGDIDVDKLIDGASRGMVAATGDPYTVFMDAEEASEFENDLGGKVSGIGAEIGVRNDRPTILRTISGSPAERAGLKRSDQIMAVNDTATIDFDAAKTAEMIRGEEGTTVKLVIMRGKEQKDFTITRASVSDSSVDSRIDGKTGILIIRRFDSDTGALARREVQHMLDQNIRGIVVDLRDNGGGYLDQAQEVAGLWLNNQLVVVEKRGDKVTERLNSTGKPLLGGIPTRILINGSSASASEIVAGALSDHGRAKLIGEKTFGKGSVQQVIKLSGGRQLKVTVARWYTPSGATISDKGITPDKEVKLSLDQLNKGEDPQLDEALRQLAK